MRHLFIVNPAAGKKRDSTAFLQRLDHLSFPHEVVFTREAGDARRLARKAIEEGGPIRLYACGGDGTLNEVVNAAAGVPFAAVTNVPMGSGNDFLKLFGPGFRSLFSDLEALANGPQASFDLMECGGMLGLDVICCGVDARVAAGVYRYKNLPFVSGSLAYLLSLGEQVLRGLSQEMQVEAGSFRWSGSATLLCVCNGRHYGGGFMPVPDAMPDDGILDTLLIPRVSLLTFARFVRSYAKGRYRDYPQYILPLHGQSVTFSSSRPLTAVVDGEVLKGTRFTVRLSEKKLSFFYPQGASWS